MRLKDLRIHDICELNTGSGQVGGIQGRDLTGQPCASHCSFLIMRER